MKIMHNVTQDFKHLFGKQNQLVTGFMDTMLHPTVGIYLSYIILALRDHPRAGICEFTKRLFPFT